MKNYDIAEDILFTNFLRSKPALSERSKIHYHASLLKFHRSNGETLGTVIDNCKDQQEIVREQILSETNGITEKKVTPYDVNRPDSYINIYINSFLGYCEETDTKMNTASHYLIMILAFLQYYGVKLPSFEKPKREAAEWNLLTKDDLKFIMADSPLIHQCLISDLKDTGMRIGDALQRSIGDFMEATSEYHNFTEVDDFIDNAPQDMIATWNFLPSKTRRFNIQCITFSGPETCNLHLQNLRKIKNETLPRINKEKGLDLRLTKSDALVASRNSHYKGYFTQHSMSDIFYRKNKKLRTHRIAMIDEAIEKGEMSADDRDDAIAAIPKFHAHACRKFFISTINRNCGNLRVCALLEGHTPPIATDPSYVKYDVRDVKEVYLQALPDLSLENTEVKVYTSEIRREMEQKISSLEEEVKIKEAETKDMEARLSRIEKLMRNIDDKPRSRESTLKYAED